MIRNRIKCRRVRAGDLIPHELNFRGHGAAQRQALNALYRDIGFARSLLAYETPSGQLKLIDGHLRRDMDPNMEVDVEILDVNDEEARALLLSPLYRERAARRAGRAQGTDPRKTDGTDAAAVGRPGRPLAIDAENDRRGFGGGAGEARAAGFGI